LGAGGGRGHAGGARSPLAMHRQQKEKDLASNPFKAALMSIMAADA